jgi:glycosyltransferase involved in cell wall biosynthesis
MAPRIQKYLHRFLKSEFDLTAPYASTGEVEKKYSELSILANEQNELIRLLTKQQSTNNITGIKLKWIEFKNTFWRMVLGDEILIRKQYHNILLHQFIEEKYLPFCNYFSGFSNIVSEKIPSKIYVDVSLTCRSNYLSGIQRVVFELFKELYASNVFPVFVNNNGAFTINKNSNSIENVSFQKSDVFFMPDANIESSNYLLEVMRQNSLVGGFNVSLVYDLIPHNYPLTCGAAIPFKFDYWLKTCAMNSDMILCNSKSVLSQLEQAKNEFSKYNNETPIIDYFPLGCDLQKKSTQKVSEKIINLSQSFSKLFLSVGTIEPRKCYSVCLDAAEKCWLAGDDFVYVIVGRYGWNQESLINRILDHCELNKRLFWFDDINDDDLSILYQSSHALIFASIDEGYGLPLIEAANHGLPLILSDIPIFCEIAGDEATYFGAANPDELATVINKSCHAIKKPPRVSSITWKISAETLINKISINLMGKK